MHKIGNYVHKISLSFFDDKKYILDDGINSLAYFQKDNTSQWNWMKSMKAAKKIVPLY